MGRGGPGDRGCARRVGVVTIADLVWPVSDCSASSATSAKPWAARRRSTHAIGGRVVVFILVVFILVVALIVFLVRRVQLSGTGLIAAWLGPWQAAELIGWVLAAVVYLASVRLTVGRLDAESTERAAAREDPSIRESVLVLLTAAVACLGATTRASRQTQLGLDEHVQRVGRGASLDHGDPKDPDHRGEHALRIRLHHRRLRQGVHTPGIRSATMMPTMENKQIIKWRSKHQKHNYPAAASYLSLVLGQQAAENAAMELESAEMSAFPAKDIFRASMSSLLGVSNSHVENERTKIIQDEKLSPLLLFRDKRNGKVIIADGYHRLCAVYTFDENAMIPCKIAGPN